MDKHQVQLLSARELPGVWLRRRFDGTIRMHQEREYPGRICATELRNPDFPAYARAFGGFGISVERTEDSPAAFREAQASNKPAIIRLAIDPEAITPATRLAKIRAKALAEKNR